MTDSSKTRSRAWRRAQDERIIKKRLNIINNIWGPGWGFGPSPGQLAPGLLRKWNLTCACGCCRFDRIYGDMLWRKKEKARNRQMKDEYVDSRFM